MQPPYPNSSQSLSPAAGPSGGTGGDDTRDRLIEAGGREFARRGFYEASVRAICAAAGANISAIKYHFGSKEGLYRAVVDVGRSQMCGGVALPLMQPGDDPRAAIRGWMGWFLRMLLITESDHPWIGEILAHEMVRPTACLDEFVQHTAGPVRAEMVRIIWSIVPAESSDEEVGRLANALIGMCASQKHARQMLTRFGFPPPSTPEGVSELADVLSRFAVDGLRGFAAAGAAQRGLDRGGGPGGGGGNTR